MIRRIFLGRLLAPLLAPLAGLTGLRRRRSPLRMGIDPAVGTPITMATLIESYRATDRDGARRTDDWQTTHRRRFDILHSALATTGPVRHRGLIYEAEERRANPALVTTREVFLPKYAATVPRAAKVIAP